MSKDLLAQWGQLQRKLAGFNQQGDHPEESPVWQPNTDVYEGPSGLVVTVELSGVSPSQIQLHLEERRLAIEGVRRDPYSSATSAGYRFRQMEIEYGPFRRQILLPYEVDGENATARVEEGFLIVRLPRAVERVRRRITVVIR